LLTLSRRLAHVYSGARRRQGAPLALKHFQRGALGALRRLADVLHVINMKIDQRTKSLDEARATARWRMALIDLRPGVTGPFARMIVPKKGLTRCGPSAGFGPASVQMVAV
jgi:hypothetical protein